MTEHTDTTFSHDEIAWLETKENPHWPVRIASEEDAPKDSIVNSKDKKEDTKLVHYLESNCFSWVPSSKLKPFEGEHFVEFSKEDDKSSDWKDALKLCTDFKKGDYKIDLSVKTEAEEPKTRKTARKTTETTPKKVTVKRKAPPVKRKQPSKFSKIVVGDIVIKEVVEHLSKTKEDNELITTLEILSRFDVPFETLRKYTIGQSIKPLLKSSNTAIAQLAQDLTKEYREAIEKQVSKEQAESKLDAMDTEETPTETKSDDTTKTETTEQSTDASEKSAEPEKSIEKTTETTEKATDVPEKTTEATEKTSEAADN